LARRVRVTLATKDGDLWGCCRTAGCDCLPGCVAVWLALNTQLEHNICMARPKSNNHREPRGGHADFLSPYRHDFVRVGACVPQVAVAEPAKNADQVLRMVETGHRDGVALLVFPELCLSA